MPELMQPDSVPVSTLVLYWRDLCRRKGRRPSRELAGRFDQSRVASLVYRKTPPKTFRKGEREAILESIADLTNGMMAEEIGGDLANFMPVTALSVRYRHLKVEIATILELDAASQRKFQSRCTGNNGFYLIFRLEKEDSSLHVALMRIRKSADKDPMTTFTTVHRSHLADRDDSTAQGVMYASGERITSFGQLRGTDQVRMTYLNMRQQNNRCDLVGIRLGLGPRDRGLRAYRVWCYQLRKPRNGESFKHLVGEFWLDEDRLNRSRLTDDKKVKERARLDVLSRTVRNFDQIVDYLRDGNEVTSR